MSCLVGLEMGNGMVKWITVQTGGELRNAVPILRKYTTTADVHKLLKLGNRQTLLDIAALPETVDESDTEDPAEVSYDEEDVPEYPYTYIFTVNSRWAYKSRQYEHMDRLSY